MMQTSLTIISSPAIVQSQTNQLRDHDAVKNSGIIYGSVPNWPRSHRSASDVQEWTARTGNTPRDNTHRQHVTSTTVWGVWPETEVPRRADPRELAKEPTKSRKITVFWLFSTSKYRFFIVFSKFFNTVVSRRTNFDKNSCVWAVLEPQNQVLHKFFQENTSPSNPSFDSDRPL